MRLPGFTAEASLFKTEEPYRLIGAWAGGSGGQAVIPQAWLLVLWGLDLRPQCRCYRCRVLFDHVQAACLADSWLHLSGRIGWSGEAGGFARRRLYHSKRGAGDHEPSKVLRRSVVGPVKAHLPRELPLRMIRMAAQGEPGTDVGGGATKDKCPETASGSSHCRTQMAARRAGGTPRTLEIGG